MLRVAHRFWRSASLMPIRSFCFDRPLVLLQSDDWGRAGVRDREGFEQLRSAGIDLGQRPYDFYTLETADDVAAVADLLKRHRDSAGRSACLEMNFVLANVDFQECVADDFRRIHLRPLSDGLPGRWSRPGLFESYAAGMHDGHFYPALHGSTHFCKRVAECVLAQQDDRAQLLRTLWKAETAYIYWRMPWIGYEYWNPEARRNERFLSLRCQDQVINEAVTLFKTLFRTSPLSACAPGYRANDDTHRAWARNGIRVAQNGPGIAPPRIDRHGILQVTRTIDFEPATNSCFSLEHCFRAAEECFSRGIPAVISMHAVNFHSSLKDFRSRTLRLLNEFLSVLEKKYPDLLYVHDADLWQIVNTGTYENSQGALRVGVKQQGYGNRGSAIGWGA